MRFTTGRVFVVAVLAIVAGVASASAFVPQPGSDGPATPGSLQPDGGATTLGSETPDPDGGPDWAVRTYTSESGHTCPEVGRVSEGRFGRFNRAAGFTELPVEAAGSCADLSRAIAAFAVNLYPATTGRAGRLAIFGAVSPAVRSVALKTPTAVESLTLDHNSFLVVRWGLTLDGLVLTLTARDGTTTSHVLAANG